MPSEQVFLKIVKESLYSACQKQFMQDIQDLGPDKKLRLFKTLKLNYCVEPYLMLVGSVTYSQCIARFRLSSHRLRIETGRYVYPKLPVNARTCLRCNGAVDTEIHLLIDCPVHLTEREILFNVCYTYIPNFRNLSPDEKFISVMTSRVANVLFSFGKFLYKCLP